MDIPELESKIENLKSKLIESNRLLSEAPHRDNVITAAISDLFVFIEKESVKALISYLVEKYSSIFTIPTQDSAQGVVSQPGSKEGEGLASVSRWVQLFQNIKLKYDQIHDTSQGSNRLLTHSYLLTHSLTHLLTYLYLLTHSFSSNSINERNRENERDDSYFFDYDDDVDSSNGN